MKVQREARLFQQQSILKQITLELASLQTYGTYSTLLRIKKEAQFLSQETERKTIELSFKKKQTQTCWLQEKKIRPREHKSRYHSANGKASKAITCKAANSIVHKCITASIIKPKSTKLLAFNRASICSAYWHNDFAASSLQI